MYGIRVGDAAEDILRGDRITVENLLPPAVIEPAVIAANTTPAADRSAPAWTPPEHVEDRTFDGYHRPDGRVGTSNCWLVIPLVFCENRAILAMRDAMLGELGYGQTRSYGNMVRNLLDKSVGDHGNQGIPSDFQGTEMKGRPFRNVDGVRFLFHSTGCGGTDRDAEALCGLLAGYITHPNTAGATVLSLGCQRAKTDMLHSEIHKRDSRLAKPLFVYEQQSGLTQDEMISKAIVKTIAGLEEANGCERKPAPLHHLIVGTECGASDAFSGLSANPVLGYTADLTVAHGGSAILSEFSELAGMEEAIIARCVSRDAAEKFTRIMREYRKKAEESGVRLDMNSSPGNIRDGLITGVMKSAGAALKGGTSAVVDVLDYPEWVIKNGLNLLCTPGSDVESTTAMAAAGANVILFSTGLGTPTGNPITPVIKVSSSSDLLTRQPDLIDVDAGGIITGKDSIPSAGLRLFDFLISVAGGKFKTRAELLDQNDFIPWKRDVSL